MLLVALLAAGAAAFFLLKDDEDFVERADAVCRDAEERTGQIEQPRTLSGIPAYADEISAVGEELRSDLEELDPPSEVEAEFDRYLANVDEGLEKVDELSAAAGGGDERQVEQIAGEISALDEENERLADAIGFEDCGRSARA